MLPPLEKSFYSLLTNLKDSIKFSADSLCLDVLQILATYDLQSALSQIARSIGQNLQAEGSFVASYHWAFRPSEVWEWTTSQEIEFDHSISPSNQFWQLLSHPTVQAEIEQSTLFTVPDLSIWMAQQDTSTTSSIAGLKVGAVLVIKTFWQGEWNGVVGLTRSCAHHWSLDEIDRLQTIAHQIGMVFSQKRLIQQVQLLEKHSQTTTERQILLEQLTMAVQNSLELNDVLLLAVQGITRSLQVDQGMVLLLKYDESALKPRSLARLNAKLKIPTVSVEQSLTADEIEHHRHVMANLKKRTSRIRATIACQWPAPAQTSPSPVVPITNETKPPAPSFRLADCALCQQAFQQSPQPIVITDWSDHPSLMPTMPLASVFQPVTMPALLLLPLVSQGLVLGFVVIQHSKSRIWQAPELEFVQLVGMQISMAIIQLQTFRQVQALVEERTVQLNRSLEIQLKLYEVTRRQLDELKRLNQEKDEFLSAVSHELRTPLTSMSLAIRMLHQPDLPLDRQRRYLDILEQQCNQETALVNDLLALQELEGQRSSVQTEVVDVNAFMQEITQAFAEKFASKQLQLKIELTGEIANVNTDRNLLCRILTELLTNANKYSYVQTEIYLGIHPLDSQPDSPVIFLVRNVGAGIAAQDLPRMFEKFWRGAGMTQQAVPGTGLGLALVKELVNQLGGTISVTSEPVTDPMATVADRPQAHQICFRLQLPRS